MKKESLTVALALFLGLAIFLNPAIASAENPGDINYNRTKFQFGQTVFVNIGDCFCVGEPFDKNGYVFPHVYKSPHIVRGIFINIEEHEVTLGNGVATYRTATVAVKGKDGQGWTITRQVTSLMPQQSTIIFNW